MQIKLKLLWFANCLFCVGMAQQGAGSVGLGADAVDVIDLTGESGAENAAGDRAALKARLRLLVAEVSKTNMEFQQHYEAHGELQRAETKSQDELRAARVTLWQLELAQGKAQDALRAGRKIYNFEYKKHNKSVKPKSAEILAIKAKLESLGEQVDPLVARRQPGGADARGIAPHTTNRW